MTGIDLGAGGGGAAGGDAGNNPGANNNAGGSGNAGGGAPPGGNSGGAGDAKPWYETSLTDAALRTLAQNKGWKGPEDAVKSYANLEPEVTRLRSQVGKAPANPAEYKFDLPSTLPEGFTVSKDLEGSFRAFAHSKGVSQEVASGMFQWYAENAAQAYSNGVRGQQETFTKKIGDTHLALEKDWGSENSPAFKRNVEMARRAISNLDPGLKDALVEAGVVVRNGGKEMVANATIFKALAKAGSELFAEDAQFSTPAADYNPFMAENESKPGAMTMMGRLVKEDPAKAALLIRAAGRERDFAHFLDRLK